MASRFYLRMKSLSLLFCICGCGLEWWFRLYMIFSLFIHAGYRSGSFRLYLRMEFFFFIGWLRGDGTDAAGGC